MNALERKLINKLSNYHEAAPVYRIEQHSLDEMETAAARLGNRVAGHKEDSKSRVVRGKGRSDLLLGDGFRARAYHPSGAIAIKAGLPPMEHLIGETADKKVLTEASVATAKRLGARCHRVVRRKTCVRAAVADQSCRYESRRRSRTRGSVQGDRCIQALFGRFARLGSSIRGR